MAFEKIVPEWLAKGDEPPDSLKESGFAAGYKPPANYFNWFWHGVSEALAELQIKAFSETAIEADEEVDLDTFNTYSHVGVWYCGGANRVLNKPNGVDSFGLLVMRSATGYFTQVLIAGNKETSKTYVRTFGADSWTVWKEVAFSDSNVASATKLETARKINGVPFDGTADISIGCIGYEPITSTEDDTPANWKALGSGYAVYTNERLNGQPTDYGFVVQYVYNSLLYQEFHSMPTGGTWYRKGNNTGWWNDVANKGTWRKVYDELHKPEQLAVARNINGVPFDGSKDIEINPVSTQIDSNGDLNNYGALGNIGFWFAAGGNAIKNKPDGVDAFGMLVIRSASGYYTQILVAGSANTNVVYNRTFNGSSWSAWASVYSDCNKPTPEDIGAAPQNSPVFTGSVSMGRTGETGKLSVAFGENVKASGVRSHAEGYGVIASGSDSHAEGSGTVAAGSASHAEGFMSSAVEPYSHAEGNNTLANNFASHAMGKWNKGMHSGGDDYSVGDGDVLVIGNGIWDNPSNAFRVTYAGATYGLSAFNASGADYAEFFEWIDGNTEAEDRIGYFVTLDGNKIRKANAGEYILGVVSGNPCIVGNSDEDWLNRWEKDEFGRFIKEEVISKDEETGEVIVGWKYKQNPNYDNTQAYVERKDRPEWDYVGMLGIVAVRDDGTCQVNGFCKVADDGTATAADGYVAGQTYRVVGRVTDNIVKVVFR